eukprot:335207-Chlamydomonas_euryale.AAC.8
MAAGGPLVRHIKAAPRRHPHIASGHVEHDSPCSSLGRRQQWAASRGRARTPASRRWPRGRQSQAAGRVDALGAARRVRVGQEEAEQGRATPARPAAPQPPPPLLLLPSRLACLGLPVDRRHWRRVRPSEAAAARASERAGARSRLVPANPGGGLSWREAGATVAAADAAADAAIAARPPSRSTHSCHFMRGNERLPQG